MPDRDEGDLEADRGAVQHAREEVAPEVVGAEGVRPRGRREAGGEVHRQRVVGGQRRAERGDEAEQQHDRSAADDQPVAQRLAQQVETRVGCAPRAAPGGGGRRAHA
jgi:hypothetical protein